MLSGNKGEWSEIYVFLRLLEDGKIYAADRDLNPIKNAFLNILKIIREEVRGHRYEYAPSRNNEARIHIFLNGADIGSRPLKQISEARNWLWKRISTATRGSCITDAGLEQFLGAIHVHKLKSPASKSAEFFGGTQDVAMQVSDYRSGVISTIGFSCKSEFGGSATLFNASCDNTNFVYEVTGGLDDAAVKAFNALRDDQGHIATSERMRFLKQRGCGLKFVGIAAGHGERNLILSGGYEMPAIVAEMLRYYYYVGENAQSHSPLESALRHVALVNPAHYDFTDVEGVYRRKVSSMLYDMFSGMRFGKPWSGRSSVNGGFIAVKSDGSVVAYHSCLADEFKDYLLSHIRFESPDNGRHRSMVIIESEGRYYIKLALQCRFFRGVAGVRHAG